VLVMTGAADQFACYDAAYGRARGPDASVVVVGGGRVGRAAGQVLGDAGIDYTIVERQAARVRHRGHYVVGDAADIDVLEEAGLRAAAAVLVTTHEDDMNVYLTLYVRKLRPEVQLISRANLDRNVTTLHRAGADAVLSYASLGASAIWNELGPDDNVVVAEGLDVFRVPVPEWLAGRSLAETALRSDVHCNVVGLVRNGSEKVEPPPDPTTPLPADASLVLVGDAVAQERFYSRDRE
jgi:Trk K+ transport system NAD-binding subunit